MQRFIFHNITFAFLILSYLCSAKNHDADSLLNMLHLARQPSEQIVILNLLSEAHQKNDPLLSYNYAEQALFLSESIADIEGKAGSKFNMALFFMDKQDYQKALNLLLESQGDFIKVNNDFGLSKNYLALGILYQNKFEYEKSLDALYQAKDLFQKLKMDKELAETYNFIGGSYYDQEDYDKAFEYFQNSLVIWEKLGNVQGLATLYNNIGEIYRLNGEYNEALGYYRNSVNLNKALNREINLAINYDNIGNILMEQINFDSALFYLEQSLEISERINNDKRIAVASNSLGKLFFRISEIDKAQEYFERGYQIAHNGSYLIFLRDASKGLSDIFKNKQQFKEALFYHRKYKQISDSIFNTKGISKIASLEMSLIFDHEKKINTIERQRNMIKYFLVVIGLLFMLIIVFLLYGRSKIKINYANIEAESLQLERKQLTEELDFKNRELATNVMYLVKKNELINFISEKLFKAKNQFTKENQKVINELILNLQSSMDADIWKDFEIRFTEVHKDFYERLNKQFPNLSENEKKLSALLKLNMTTKEIAAITHQTPNSIEVARTRLRKKIGLSNKDINLVSYLSNL